MWGALAGILGQLLQGKEEQDTAGPLNAFEASADKYRPQGMGQYQGPQQMPQQQQGPFGGGQNLSAVMQALAQRFGGQGGRRF